MSAALPAGSSSEPEVRRKERVTQPVSRALSPSLAAMPGRATFTAERVKGVANEEIAAVRRTAPAVFISFPFLVPRTAWQPGKEI